VPLLPDDPLARAARRLVVDEQPTEDLPALATDALVRGVDSPALRQLAGTSPGAVRDARDTFWEAMTELGMRRPTPVEARWQLVFEWADDIVAGRISPIQGASRIWWDGWEHLGHPDELTAFAGLASQWDDDPEHRSDYERDIRDEAATLLSRRQ
jgi:hypothetical protein